MKEQELISKCKSHDSIAQKELYDKYVPVLMSVAFRYLNDYHLAEDVVQISMFKILTKIDQFNYKGSFEGWMRKIVANESLMLLRKNKSLQFPNEDKQAIADEVVYTSKNLEIQDILKCIERLPDGYKIVFNLYVIEGFKHREIAEMLGISINTSKSQLILAKKKMIFLLKEIGYPII